MVHMDEQREIYINMEADPLPQCCYCRNLFLSKFSLKCFRTDVCVIVLN